MGARRTVLPPKLLSVEEAISLLKPSVPDAVVESAPAPEDEAAKTLKELLDWHKAPRRLPWRGEAPGA